MNNRVKIQYRKPLLELCSPNKKIETVLTDRTQMSAYNITLVEKVNETTELTFSMPFENTKINNQDCEKLVKLNGEYYVIKEISVSDANSRVIEVKCIHESVELKGILCETIDVIGVTASEMFKAIKDSCTSIDMGYEFKGTDIPDTTKRALQNDNEVSVYENLVKMAEVFQAVLEFSTNTDGVKQIYLRKGSIERGKYLKKSNGLKQLNLTYDSNELFTRVIPFGYTDSDGIELNIMGVSPTGKSYVENYDYFLAKGMTYDEIKNNPRCNQEMIYRDTNIVDEHDLYRLAMEELEKCSVPVLNGSIDMVDFSIFEGSALLAPVLCEEIIVIDKDINFSIKAKITGIERNYDNPLRTRVEISNVIKYNSVFKDLVNAGNKIDKITSSDSEGNIIIGGSFVQGKINAHKTQIVGMLDSIEKPEDKYAILFEDRRVGSPLFGALAIGSRGILIANEVDGKEEWIWRTAINANAISASEINTGVLNADLIKAGVLQSLNEKSWIDMDDGSFSFADGRITYNDTDGFKIFLSSDPEVSDLETELNKYKKEIQNDINDITSKLDSMDEEFWDAFADGIIDEAEANMIKQKLLDLNKEKADIDSRYNTVYNNVNLINPAKKSLYNAYNNFTTKHNNLIDTIEDIIADEMSTVSEMEQFKKAFDAYVKTTPTLSKAFDDAVTNISYNMTTTQINDYNTLVQEDIKHVSDSVDNLEDVMNSSFRDGIIDEAEYIAIIESMSRLQSEKTDIDKNFDSLYSNLNLTGISKTNLKSKYDAYVLAHDTLINYVNNSIGDKIATEEEKAEIKRLLTVYDTALGEFGVAQTQAINNIADNSANNLLEEYKKEVDADIKDINDKLSDLEDDVTDAIYDGIIEEAEAIVIENSIKELNKEKQDIKVRYDEIYKNSGLSSSGKSSLKTAYTAYSTVHTALINQINDMIEDRVATSAEKIEYEECIKAYDDKFSELSKAFDNALNEIALNNANTIMEALKEELQANIKDVEDIAKSLKEQLGDFTADGILDEAEKQSIKTMLKTLATEKSDVTNQYNTVYANPDLTGTAKSNLSTAYVNYNSGYNSLITVIESILSKDSVSDGDRTTLDTSFATHDNYLAVYSKRVSEAIDAIAKKKKEDAITESKDYYDAQIKLDKDSILATVSRTYSEKAEVDTLANELRSVESKLEQRADKIELSVTEIQQDVYDIIPNGDFSATSTTNWVTYNINKSAPTTLNSKRWLRIYNTTETITTDAICSCEFTLKYDTAYSFSLLVAQRVSSMTFYRVTLEGFNSNVRSWQTIKTWTGTTMGTTGSPTKLTYSYTYPTGSVYGKLRLAVKRLLTDPVMDIYITDISVTCKDTLAKTSQIKILSDSIESKVSSGDMGTLIEQNYEAVKIAWNNNSKYVQFENGGMAIYNASVSNSQKRAFINEYGVNYWRDGYQLGRIGTNTYTGDSTKRGIVFDLDSEGAYMTWANKKESTETTYKMRWTYVNKSMGSFREDCLNAGCNIYMGYYDIIDSDLKWSKNTDLAEIYFYSANDENSQLRLIIGDNTNDTIGMYYKGTDFNTTNQIYTICDWSYGGSYVYTNLDMNNHSITNTGIVTSYNFNQLEEVTTFATYKNTDDYSQETLLLNNVTTRQAPITRTLTRAIVPNIEWSGSATVLDGVCNLQLPNDVHYTDYTIVITPIGNHHIYVHEKQDDVCVIKGDDCEFDFIIKFAQPESSLVRDLTTGIVGRVVKCESEKYKEKPIEMILKQE